MLSDYLNSYTSGGSSGGSWYDKLLNTVSVGAGAATSIIGQQNAADAAKATQAAQAAQAKASVATSKFQTIALIGAGLLTVLLVVLMVRRK